MNNVISCDATKLKLPSAEKIVAAFEGARDAALDQMGERMLSTVTAAIRFSGMTIRTGNILTWQKIFRKEGYVAVRPQIVAVANREADSKQITKYLDHGHGVREASRTYSRFTRAKWSDRSNNYYVPGFQFYSASRRQLNSFRNGLAKEIDKEITDKMSKL